MGWYFFEWYMNASLRYRDVLLVLEMVLFMCFPPQGILSFLLPNKVLEQNKTGVCGSPQLDVCGWEQSNFLFLQGKRGKSLV